MTNTAQPSDDLDPSRRPDWPSLFWFLMAVGFFLAWVFNGEACR